MRYLLDTNVISALYDKKSPYWQPINERFTSLAGHDFYVSTLSIFEFEYSFSNATSKKQEKIRWMLREIKQHFLFLPVTKEQAKYFGEIKKTIKDSRGVSSKNMKRYNIDIMLAASAISGGCRLVSRDKIYQDIAKVRDDFQYENWAINQTR